MLPVRPPSLGHDATQRGDRMMLVRAILPAALAAIAESALLYVTATGRISWTLFLVGHAIVIGLLSWSVHRAARRGDNAAMPLLTAITVAATGPIGAMAAVINMGCFANRPADNTLLDDWYARIANAVETDAVTRLCEQVSTGRTSSLTGSLPASFTTVMERGSLDDQQALLGIIARNFHADYLPALMLALKSPEPVIRVQAAAVATRIRGNLRTLVDRFAGDLTPVSPGTGAALTAAAQLDAAIASGLLDEGDRIRARVIAERLRISSVGASDATETLVAVAPIIDRQATEVALLSAGRFRQLRIGRRIAAVETARLYRVRRPRHLTSPEAG